MSINRPRLSHRECRGKGRSRSSPRAIPACERCKYCNFVFWWPFSFYSYKRHKKCKHRAQNQQVDRMKISEGRSPKPVTGTVFDSATKRGIVYPVFSFSPIFGICAKIVCCRLIVTLSNLDTWDNMVFSRCDIVSRTWSTVVPGGDEPVFRSYKKYEFHIFPRTIFQSTYFTV